MGTLNSLKEVLTITEFEAIKIISSKIEDQGIIAVSSISENKKITRSIICSALRLLEVAGVVRCSSMGNRGTHIQILDRQMLDQLVNEGIQWK